MKKILALLLIVCMILPLAACGGATETGAAVETSDESLGDETVHTIASAVTIPEGETYDFASHLPLVKEGEDNKLTVGLRADANCTDYKDNDYTRWLEEKTGVDLEFIQFSGTAADAATQIALMTAAGEKLPDILIHFTGITKAQGEVYGRDGYFLDLKDYFMDPDMNYYRRWGLNHHFYYDETVNDMLMLRGTDSETGAIYSYPFLVNDPEDNPKCHTVINRLWLEKLGLEMPTTIDELYDVLVAFRDQDPNGNGKKDEIPMISRVATYKDIIHWLMNAFLFVDDSYYFTVENDKLDLPYDKDEYRQAMIFIKKLVDEGLLSPQTWTISAAEHKGLLNPEDGVYTVGISAGTTYTDFLASGHSMQDYQIVPPLKDAGYGKGGYGPMSYYRMEYNTFITEDCDDPELAFRLLDFMCAPDNTVRMYWGMEGRDWEYVDKSEGLTGHLGGPADIRLLADPDIHTYPNNIIWQFYLGLECTQTTQTAVDLSDPDSFISARYKQDTDLLKYYAEAGQPDEVFYFNVYTADEIERRNEFVTDIQSYLRTARADFCNGVTDPASDADWQAYLDNLDRLGKAEWLEIAQTAYNRTFGKNG